ncbi:hypothetical protein B296_00047021 [Ensete ventricosum]|uniref:Uncharacterized protein n=1 Tax=Ensete ventricosum TaxID=4639 RepID=A0A426Z1G8_ENSVE|nr:hypothetical protein B296_00047021 [Ensete ventricosum]
MAVEESHSSLVFIMSMVTVSSFSPAIGRRNNPPLELHMPEEQWNTIPALDDGEDERMICYKLNRWRLFLLERTSPPLPFRNRCSCCNSAFLINLNRRLMPDC